MTGTDAYLPGGHAVHHPASACEDRPRVRGSSLGGGLTYASVRVPRHDGLPPDEQARLPAPSPPPRSPPRSRPPPPRPPPPPPPAGDRPPPAHPPCSSSRRGTVPPLRGTRRLLYASPNKLHDGRGRERRRGGPPPAMDSPLKGEGRGALSDLERAADGQYVFMLDDLEAGGALRRVRAPCTTACAARLGLPAQTRRSRRDAGGGAVAAAAHGRASSRPPDGGERTWTPPVDDGARVTAYPSSGTRHPVRLRPAKFKATDIVGAFALAFQGATPPPIPAGSHRWAARWPSCCAVGGRRGSRWPRPTTSSSGRSRRCSASRTQSRAA